MPPDEEQTLEFKIWPASAGGWIVRIQKHDRAKARHYWDLGDIVSKVQEETVAFYEEITAELQAKIDADLDVTRACCPECEDQTIVEKPQLCGVHTMCEKSRNRA